LVATGHRFQTIYADPPWSYRNLASRAAARLHYSTMSLAEICSLPVSELVSENAHLHLWATTPLLEDALRVIDAWGFKYKSCFVWAKDKLGMGNYWRVSHELLLLGVRGKLRFRDRTVRSWCCQPLERADLDNARSAAG
jgi:N6-adenosine-specific RNA methylase IME4